MKNINNISIGAIIAFCTVIISIISLIVFSSNNMHLSDYDAIARLNIARRVIDSQTPGVGQLGGVWPPLPQILFLPTIWINFMWHSGLSAAIVSMTTFCLSAFYLYKTVYRITNSKLGSIAAWLVYVTNINVLLLQTMGMSEVFFMFCLVMSIYHLTQWLITKRLSKVLISGIYVSLITLTRYEGYAFWVAAIICVGVGGAHIYRNTKRKKLEGIFIMFTTLASMGIFVWALYSALIFKDPLHWLHLYTGQKDQIQTLQSDEFSQSLSVNETSPSLTLSNEDRIHSFGESFATYTWSLVMMSGVLVTLLSSLALLYVLAKFLLSIYNKNIEVSIFPILFISLFMFLFLVIGYQRGLIPNIQVPEISLDTLINRANNSASSSNIRYGLFGLPLMALVIGIFAGTKKWIAVLISVLIIIQFAIVHTDNPLFLIFQLPEKQSYKVSEQVKWFSNNYDGGMILISSNRYEPFMFQTGLNYDHFIYEGSQHYWLESLEDPSKYAKWVIFDSDLRGDAVDEFLVGRSVLDTEYEIVYEDNGFKIYKIKTEPDINLLTNN